MRRRLLVAALLIVAVAEGRAQSFLELLQNGIYLQDTVGDMDGAIRLYRQILAGAPAGEIRTQAQRRLDSAEARRRQLPAHSSNQLRAQNPGPSRELGVVEGQRYRHIATGLTFVVPDDWTIGPTGASSDFGEMVTMVLKDPVTHVSVWMIKEANDWDEVNRRLDASPALKTTGRIEGWGLADYRIREGSAQRTTVNGRAAMMAVGEYTSSGQPMAELLFWIYTEQNRAFFFSAVPAADLERLRPQFEALVHSTVIP